MSLFYGTAGWSYKDWIGTVYPEKIPSNFNYLHFIASKFDFVEVNTTFYRTPDIKMVYGWLKKTESIENFSFWIKLNRMFTHSRNYSDSDVKSFNKSIAPLSESNKLSGILLQFPYSFKYSNKNSDYLFYVADNFNCNIAVEFRHLSWINSDLIQSFKERELIWVNIDQPVISQSLPLTSIVTNNGVSYFRLHGRNYNSWFADKGRDARYDYCYSERELFEISGKIIETSKRSGQTFISGNNHYKGSAVKNLVGLKNIINKRGNSG